MEGSGVVLVTATDGNHGRAVARMAALLGLQAQILVPADMAAARAGALRAEGAQVTVVDGTYDQAVARSAALADDRHVVSDKEAGSAPSRTRSQCCGSRGCRGC
jgi:diaminopropionate ammonia-lyase